MMQRGTLAAIYEDSMVNPTGFWRDVVAEPLTALSCPGCDLSMAATPTTPATVRARCAFWLAYLRKIKYLKENA
jgi:hypothetical protein